MLKLIRPRAGVWEFWETRMRSPTLKSVLCRRPAIWAVAALAFVVAGAQGIANAGVGGQLEIKVVDQETGEPLACRIHLTNQAARFKNLPRFPSGTIIS